MNIIIPLGGKGERFKNSGYDLPKPLIKVLDKEILFYVIDNLDIQNNDNVFIIYNKDLENYNFEDIIKNKYPFINLKKLSYNTKGACETVYNLTCEIINNDNIHLKTILIDGDAYYTNNILEKVRNIDTNGIFYIKNYDIKPVYSYIEILDNNIITKIIEKVKISDNANTGAYFFNNIYELNNNLKYVLENNILFNNEPYISCVIDIMLKNNFIFTGIEVNENNVYVLGTPEQVKQYENNCLLFQFDLDGTLVLTDKIYIKIWKNILEKYNIYLTDEIFYNIIQGNNDLYVINKLLPNTNIDINKISLLKDELFIKNINDIEIINGSEKILKKIKENGNKITIVTNCNRNVAITILKKTNLYQYIDEIIIGNECDKPKPYPDPYLKGCNIFNISNKKTIIFEDSKTGIESAKGINPKCLIGIETLYDSKTLLNLGVNISIKNYLNINYHNLIKYKDIENNDIEKYIKDVFKDAKEIIIDNKKIKGGYISDVIKVNIILNNDEKINCILKLENKNINNLTIMANNLGLYEREYYFYENISKYVNIEIPKFYSLIKDNNLNNIGILMEELNREDYILNLNLNNENINTSLKIIESCAKFHSKFWNKDLTNIFNNLQKNNHPMFNPVWSEFIKSRWDLFKNKWSFLLNDKLIKISENVVNNFTKIQENLSDKNLTLCHGDVKSPNIFYKKNNKKDDYTPYFIDWQYISNGKGVQDIVFFMIESFDINKIKIYMPLFKNYYYIKLQEYGVINYSYNDYEKDFINSIFYFPFFVAIWFGTVPEEDLIDKNFPFFFIQKLFNFIDLSMPNNFII